MGKLAALSAGLGLLGVAGQTASQVQAANLNQRLSEMQARSAEEQAMLQERQFRRRAMLAQGETVSSLASSGLAITSGTPLLRQLDLAKQAEIEALNIRRTGQIEASARRFEGRLSKAGIPWSIAGGALQGGSILTNLFARKT